MLRTIGMFSVNLNFPIYNPKLISFKKYLRYIELHKFCTASTTLVFKSNFSHDEEEKILNTINKSSDEELLSYNVSQSRVKNIQKWKNKMGPFKSLNDILEVDGLGEKVLEKICKKIVSVDENIEESSTKKLKVKHKKLVMPVFDLSLFQELQSVTGIYLNTMGFSCARICRSDNSITHWNLDLFHELPKKMTLVDTFNSANILVQKIPPSDVYVFESIASLSPTGQNQPVIMASHNQQQELVAMLLTLLNTSSSHNMFMQMQNCNTLPEFIENRVFFIKSKLPARLFNLLVGNEKVSANKIMFQILDLEMDNFKLPCRPVTVDNSIRNHFKEHSTSNKELLGQALLIVVTFMELFVYNNSKSWSVLSSRNKK